MRSLIVIGGAAPEKLPLECAWDRIVAADSGYDTALKLGLKPDSFVGDGDSTSMRKELEDGGQTFLSVDKDDTDFTAAVKMTEGDYDLVGGGEGRLDHTLGIFSTFMTERPPLIWFTHEDALFSGRKFEIDMPLDTMISFFPVDLMKSTMVRTDGLKWDVTDRKIDLSFFSLSNRTAKEHVVIESSGPLFIRIPLSMATGEYTISVC